jgi:cystathionine beta-synthase/cysteine synthase A
VAKRIHEETPNSYVLDQFWNEVNPDCHYLTTGAEIVTQMGGKLDYLVAGIGTGGTLSGIARRLKEEVPNCKIVAVDPVGSIMGGGTLNAPYLVEGIGYDFMPGTYHPHLVDQVVKTEDPESFRLARRIIREEGMLVGGSSGSAMIGALEVAKTALPGSRIVVVFADSVRNYMSKFLDPAWLRANGMETD